MREQQAVICWLALSAHRLFSLLQLVLGNAVSFSKTATDPDCGSSLFFPLHFTSILCRAWVRFSVPLTPLLWECKKLPFPEWSCRKHACLAVALPAGGSRAEMDQVGMYGDHKDLCAARLVLDSVGILRDDLEVYNSVQCLSYILTDQHFSWATFILFLFKKNSFNCMSLILTYAMSY